TASQDQTRRWPRSLLLRFPHATHVGNILEIPRTTWITLFRSWHGSILQAMCERLGCTEMCVVGKALPVHRFRTTAHLIHKLLQDDFTDHKNRGRAIGSAICLIKDRRHGLSMEMGGGLEGF